MRVLSQHHEKIGNPQASENAPTPATARPAASITTTPAIPSSSTSPAGGTTSAPKRPAQAQSNRAGRGPAIFPIEGLSPYQNHWTIKARCTNKSDIRTWSNQRGEGKLFSVVLCDESGEIKATGFNTAVDDLYNKFEEGKVYYVSKAKVNLAKKQYSNVANEYELTFDRNSEVEECHDTTNLPTVRYNFVLLSALADVAKDSVCDVIGVVSETGPATEFTSRAGRPSMRRELTIVDKTGFSVRMTLWGKQAEQFAHTDNPVLAVKGVKVSDFGGRSLSASSSCSFDVNPDINDAHILRGWYDAGGNTESFKAQSGFSGAGGSVAFNRDELRTIEDVKESQLGQSDKPEYFSCRGTIMHVKNENFAYPACPTQGCSKKVFDQHDGWRCEKCDRSFEKPEYRYLISIAVADHTGQAWFSGFNDLGISLFEKPAEEVVEVKERDEAAFNKIIEGAIGKCYHFTCRAKQDSYNESIKVRYGVMKILPYNYREEANHLKELLSSPWAQ